MLSACAIIASDHQAEAWYIAATQSRKECVAIENLRLQKFRTFFPRLARPSGGKRGGAARKMVASSLTALFPGYVFVSFDRDEHRWQSINGTVGIRGLIGGEARGPAQVPQTTMAELFARCPDGVWDNGRVDFCRGDKVEVTGGPFLGTQGRFDEFLSQDRVKILFELISGAVSASLPKEQIEKRS